MFGIGTGELLLLLVIALLVLGPERMPKLARDLGKTVGDLRRTSDELRNEFLNADRTLNAEKLLDVASRTASAPTPAAEGSGEAAARGETGKAAEIGATMGETAPPPASAAEPAPPDVGATQAEVVSEPSEPSAPAPELEETVFDRELRLARERLDKSE
ncbi:MAG: twin-arginine translocase subunit TatB [Chloroflexi bacterium]|nr:twin-arginine translocase subunit TatB [Chloroflexota bacterium]